MKTVKVIERYDASGNLIERVTETTETIEAMPYVPYVPYMPQFTPVPSGPYTEPFKITWGPTCHGTASC